MAWKSLLIRPYANYVARNVKRWSASAVADQQKWMCALLHQAQKTDFGKTHHFNKIKNHTDFKKNIPLRNYEDFQNWLDKIFKGEKDVLWPGQPLYFAKSSGTTSGAKYIPISRDSINHHFLSAQSASLCFMAQSGNYNIMDGKMIFLSGSPELEMHYGIKTGRLSGIINHHIPGYLSRNRLPSPAVNRIDDWEEKLEAIANESIPLDLSLIGGIPPWIQMYFDLLQKKSKKSIAELFPNLKLLVHGGVNFKPYQKRLEQSLGRKINMIETYPASEAFIAFQEDYLSEGMLLNTDAGIFYEFIPLEQVFEKNPKRLSLAEVDINRQYAIVISTNAGLWAYLLGDTIRFVSLNPHRIKVTGRIKHQLSAFGEHVIAEEVETAIKLACSEFDVLMEEFTVAPAMGDAQNLPCHEWVIAVSEKPKNEKAFAAYLDEQMYRQNIYYQDLVKGKVIQPLKVRWVKAKTFHNAMKKMGKLGGQNKAPRLMNDRSFVDLLIKNAQ